MAAAVGAGAVAGAAAGPNPPLPPGILLPQVLELVDNPDFRLGRRWDSRVRHRATLRDNNHYVNIECVHPVDDVYDILDGVVSASVLRLMILIYEGLRCLSFLVPSCPLYTSFILHSTLLPVLVHGSCSSFSFFVIRVSGLGREVFL
jgi:hypothetical protein